VASLSLPSFADNVSSYTPACDGVGVQETTPVAGSTLRFVGTSASWPRFRKRSTANRTCGASAGLVFRVNLISVFVSWAISSIGSIASGAWRASTAGTISSSQATASLRQDDMAALGKTQAGPSGGRVGEVVGKR